ncbi:MAG: glycosyltransferase [Planctomycetaceae bacterium]|nr:glycosyltransferase [Planctomycetaceae bacterium]
MDAWWLTVYLILMGLVLVQSLLVALQTWEHRRYVRSCMRDLGRHQPTGRVALFAPCKGVDLGLETNLRALMEQDYDDYEITFIVESADDPACTAIRRAMAAHPWVPSRVVIAGRAAEGGQKVHNLRVGMEHLSSKVQYLAFVDSDARPRPEWLRMLVARLAEPGCGAVTGYRWFTPERATVANALVYSMNCDILSLLTRSSHYLIWGGSWAIRREVFDRIGLREAWRGTLSDDLVASRLMRRAKLGVRFEPACVVASPLDESLGSALAFIRRQYLIARFYTIDWWLFSLVAATFSSLTWLVNLMAFGWSLVGGGPSPWIPLGVSALLYLVTVYRGWLRQDLVKTYFPHWERASRPIQRFDIWANPLVEFAHWVGVASAAVGRRIDWRGIRYHVLPGGRVEAILRRDLAYRQTADLRITRREAA